MSDDRTRATSSRRAFLTALGATGAALSVGTVAGAGRQQVATSYLLDGRTAAWVGREPESIAGTNNPTLNLEAGRTYEITWENVDGQPHNVAILSGDGEVLVRTEIISGQGATQSVQFTAAPEMETYLCQVHPTSMVGDVVVEGGGQQGQTQTPAANGTDANRTRVGAQETTTAPDGAQTPTAQPDGNRTRVGAQETTTAPGDGTTPPREETTAPAAGAQNQTTIPNPTAAPVEETTHPLTGAFGEDPAKFGADLEPAPGVETDAAGRAWFTLHPPNGSQPTLLYSLHLENAENVTEVRIQLDMPGDPTVAQLFRPDSPADVIDGTLVDSQLVAGDLTGPFQGGSLLRLTEAIRNDNAYVVVAAQQQPEGLLRGPIQPAEAEEDVPTATPTGTTPAGDDETVSGAVDGTTPAGANETTPSTGDGMEAAGVDADSVAQQVRAPGFGALSALGGLGGLAGYLYSRSGTDDD